MRNTTKFLALAGLFIGFAGEASAQRPNAGAARGPQARPEAPRGPGNVTAMLNARRQLDLTPRQVAQLDSIERGLHAERQRVAERTRPAMDSLRERMRGEGAPRDERQREEFRAQAEQRRAAMRPEMERLRQRDSVATAAADRLLNDTQRNKWREMQAERRGFERGMREGRGRQEGMQGRQGRPGNRGASQMRPPMGNGQGGPGGQPAPGRRP